MPRYRISALFRLAGPAFAVAVMPISAAVMPASAGTTARAAVPSRYTLTAVGTNLAGQPDTGASVQVCNADDSRRYCAAGKFQHGTASFRLPAGNYWAFALFVDLAGGKPTAGRMVVLPQFTVSGNRAVRLAESAANSKITMVTPQPATRLDTIIDFQRTAAAGPAFEASIGAGPGQALWVSPTRQRPSQGTLRFGAEQWLASPPGPGSPYLYDLAYQWTGAIPAQRYLVRPGSLATVDDRFYGAVSSAGYSEPEGWFPHAQFQGGPSQRGFGVRVPGRRIDYFSGNPSIVWHGNYESASGLEDDLGRTFRAGQRLTDDWGGFPLHPAPQVNLAGAASPVPVVPSASRLGNVLQVDVTPFTDNTPGHLSFGFFPPVPGPKPTGSFEIDQDGKKIAAGNAHAYGAAGPHVTLSPRPSVIRFVLNASRTGPDYPLSVSSHTVWTWRSRREPGATLPRGWSCFLPGTEHRTQHCSVQPMMTLGYRVAGLALDGSTRPGRQLLAITVGHLQLATAARVTRVTVQVSGDGGTHWHFAKVTGHGARYTASYNAPAGSYVTLRTTASDAAGGQISETITRAYRIQGPRDVYPVVLAAGLPPGWNTPSTQSVSWPVFSRQCGVPGGRCTQLPAASGRSAGPACSTPSPPSTSTTSSYVWLCLGARPGGISPTNWVAASQP